MLYLSIALVLLGGMAFNLINKWMDIKVSLNNKAVDAALSEATAELSKKFDQRINKAFENHQLIKSELDSLKLQIGLKGNR